MRPFVPTAVFCKEIICLFIAVCAHTCVHVRLEARRGRGGSSIIILLRIPLRQGLSLNLEFEFSQLGCSLPVSCQMTYQLEMSNEH